MVYLNCYLICLDGVSELYRICLDGVSELYLICLDGVSELYLPERMGDNPSILASEDLEYEFIKDKNSLIIR